MKILIALGLCLSLVTPATAQAPQGPRIMFETDVNDDSVATFIDRLNASAANGHREITVLISSPGGSVGAGIEMSKAIERSPATVVCVVDGMAASMALYILQSCDVRVMTSRSLLMGHEPATGMQGQPDDMRDTADLLVKIHRALAAHVVHRMSISVEEYEALTAHGRMWWLNSDEALRVGAVDMVVSARGI